MSEREFRYFVLDILLAIDFIERMSADFKNSSDLVSNEIVFAAIARQCEIIGEGMKHILQSAQHHSLKCPSYWKDVVDFRNVVVHQYFGLNYEEIYNIISEEIPGLEKDVIKFLKKLPNQDSLIAIFASMEDDLSQLKREESLEYLHNLKEKLKIE